jgi:hypothetical protein
MHNAAPRKNSPNNVERREAARGCSMRIRTVAAIKAPKLAALIRKHQPSLTMASSTPATDGPTSRPLFIRNEFRAMAFGRSSWLPTIRPIRDCRAGVSNAITTPYRNPRVRICHDWSVPVSARMPRVSACKDASACATIMIRRRSKRSLSNPANGVNRSSGIWLQNATSPSISPEPVVR